MSEKILFSQEIEAALVGACLSGKPEVLYRVFDIISPEDCYFDEFKIIMKAIKELVEKQTEVDIAVVSEYLRQKGELDKVGGLEFLVKLYNSTVATANASAYAKLVRKYSTARKIEEISKWGYENAGMLDNDELLNAISEKIIQLRENKPRDKSEVLSDIIDGFSHVSPYFKTGYNVIDRYVRMERRTYNVIAARPGVGKTSLALNMGLTMSKEKIHVLFVSYEMSTDELLKRALSAESSVAYDKIQSGNIGETDAQALLEASARIAEDYTIEITDTAPHDVNSFTNYVKKRHAELPLDVVFIDYMQLMSSKGYGYGGSRVAEISDISMKIKRLARELNISIIALSQLSRAIEKRGENSEPRLSDLKESSSIEQDADSVIFLYGDEEDLALGDISIKVAKNRNGQVGDGRLYFRKSIQKFEEVGK